MTSPTKRTDAMPCVSDGLAFLVGQRRAEILRFLWSDGPATVRQIHQRMPGAAGLAYTTIATLCTKLTEKGLLHQQLADMGNLAPRRTTYLYTAMIAEHDLVRQLVGEQLDALLAHFPELVSAHIACTCAAPANAQVAAWQVEARTARAAAETAHTDAIHRVQIAERQAEVWQAEAQRANQRVLQLEEELRKLTRTLSLQSHPSAAAAPEHYDPSGICRVCGQSVPTPPATQRRDGLRVCDNADCRTEAKRRDNVIKQRHFRERQRSETEHP